MSVEARIPCVSPWGASNPAHTRRGSTSVRLWASFGTPQRTTGAHHFGSNRALVWAMEKRRPLDRRHGGLPWLPRREAGDRGPLIVPRSRSRAGALLPPRASSPYRWYGLDASCRPGDRRASRATGARVERTEEWQTQHWRAHIWGRTNASAAGLAVETLGRAGVLEQLAHVECFRAQLQELIARVLTVPGPGQEAPETE